MGDLRKVNTLFATVTETLSIDHYLIRKCINISVGFTCKIKKFDAIIDDLLTFTEFEAKRICKAERKRKKGKQEPRDHHQTRHSPNSLALFATDSLELKVIEKQ